MSRLRSLVFDDDDEETMNLGERNNLPPPPRGPQPSNRFSNASPPREREHNQRQRREHRRPRELPPEPTILETIQRLEQLDDFNRANRLTTFVRNNNLSFYDSLSNIHNTQLRHPVMRRLPPRLPPMGNVTPIQDRGPSLGIPIIERNPENPETNP